MGRKVPFRCSVRLHCRLLRPFSDSFNRKSDFSDLPSDALLIHDSASGIPTIVLPRTQAHEHKEGASSERWAERFEPSGARCASLL